MELTYFPATTSGALLHLIFPNRVVARSVGKTHGPSVRGVSRVSALTQPQWMKIHNKKKTKDDQDKGHCHIYVYPDVTSTGKYSNVHRLCCRWWRVAKWVFYAHLGPLIFISSSPLRPVLWRQNLTVYTTVLGIASTPKRNGNACHLRSEIPFLGSCNPLGFVIAARNPSQAQQTDANDLPVPSLLGKTRCG